jgi:P27 family predicted phage terminase small subunit
LWAGSEAKGGGGGSEKCRAGTFRGTAVPPFLFPLPPLENPILWNNILSLVQRYNPEQPAMELHEPPPHLSASAREWWKSTVETYVLQEHHLRLLQLCCEAWDEAQKARDALERDGLTVPGREGGLRPHPCVAIERDARLAVARLVRELDLDVEPPKSERFGPAAIFSNRGGNRARKTTAS